MLKKGKRFLSLLCCIALTASMTLDVCAAEGFGFANTTDRTQAAVDADSEPAESAAFSLGKVEETEPSESKSSVETLESTEPEKEQSSEYETETGTETQETVSEAGTEEESSDKISESGVEIPTETETNSSTVENMESLSETETEVQEEESCNPNAGSTERVSANYIFDDAFVSNFSGADKTNYKDNQNLIIGKGRHIYIRFDLSEISADAEKIIFQGVKKKLDSANKIVVTECSEYLRQDDSNDSADAWTTDNITYENRPRDMEHTVYNGLDWSSGNLEIDLTDFIKTKKQDNADTACIHITTTTVDDGVTGAAEIYSSRDTSSRGPKLEVYMAKVSENNIFDSAYVSNQSGKADTNFSTATKLTFGKYRHVYLRFDLADIEENSNKIIFRGIYMGSANLSNTIVVKESSEYLRQDESNDSKDQWTTDNITYTNRPLDKDNVLYDALEWSSGNLELDLTDFIKAKKQAGAETACIHITTANPDSDSDTAVDIGALKNTDKSKKPALVVKTSVYNIFDDAYVDSSKGTANNASSGTLIFGKSRHVYLRFDLSNIAPDADKIIFCGTYAKGAQKPVVVTACSEFLRADDSTDGKEEWTTGNITWNNRPLDAGEPLYEELAWTDPSKLEIDLTAFIKSKMEKGDKTACIHFTTTTVDDTAISAVEINSTRSDSGKPKLVVSSPNDEKPEGLERKTTVGSYYDNGSVIQKVIRIKTADNKYLKVDGDGTVKTSGTANDASLFGLHIYQYDKFEQESYGATKTTYAFENLADGKFLTIQNYFAENDASKSYWSQESSGKYIIKATAPDVNWNERFDVQYYADSQYYTIASHLQALRDSSGAVSPVYVESDTLKCGKSDDVFRFYLEEVENEDRLKVLQEVNGSSARLFWKPVNQDKTPENYIVEGHTVAYDAEKDALYTEIGNLEPKLYEFTVKYENQEEKVKVRIFNHLALAHSEVQLDAMKAHVAKKVEPWYSDYQRLVNQVPYNMSNDSYAVTAYEAVGRGDPAGHGNIAAYERSSNAAYFNALQWVITGEDKYAAKGVEILNAWCGLKILDGRDRILGAAISTYRMNNAAEILKYYHGGYSGYSDEDFKKYQDMMLNVIYPVIQDLGLPMIANGNWDTAAMAGMVSIGAVCENTEIFERAVYLYQDIHTNGSVAVYVSDWGQSVESFRDQAHAQFGISLLADVCVIVEKQGIDLWSLYDNRLAKAFNWAAQYNLYDTENLKMEPLTDVFGRNRWSSIDSEKINRGELRSVYELPLAHYSKVDGVDVTWMKKAAEAMRPQGFVNNDHLNFGTLTTYNGEATKAAEPYFQLRTRLEPWYQRTWNDVKKYGEIQDNIPETLNSYFTVDESGTLTVSGRKADAPFFQMENQADGSCAVRCVKTNRYLSVKEDTYNDGNVIKADAVTVGENEKFILKGTGASFFYLEAKAFENRILNVNVENGDDPQNAVLTLYLGTRKTVESDTVTNNERFILVYNTADVALKDAPLVDTSALEEYLNGLSEVNNDDHKYTTDSWQAYSEKLEAAKTCLQDAKDGNASQSDINNALRELQEAYDSLLFDKPAEDVVSAPAASIPSGEILADTEVTLTCATEGAAIYYTIDGSNPEVKDELLYKYPIVVNAPVTIKAMAVKDGYRNSEVVTYTYTIAQTDPDKFVYAPTADVQSGKIAKGTKVTLSCVTGEAFIYYTTDKSEPTALNGTLYENPIVVNETVTIKAIAVKGQNTSAVSTFVYEVSGGSQGGDDKPEQVSAPAADKVSGTEVLLKGTRITLTCATEGAEIYYTTDESEPAIKDELLYKNPIPVNRDMTIKAIAAKEGVSSTVAVFTYTVSTGLRITVDGIPYYCSTDNIIVTDALYTYTGSAITPEITVVNNGELLTNGTDYTVKYANNIKVPAANAKSTQQPKITIIGKNNLKGNAVLYFAIQPKSIAAQEEGIAATEPLVVVENKKAAPVVYYNGRLLKANQDFTMSDAGKKWTSADNDKEITLTGKGNYAGERKMKVSVVGKNTLQKFTVELDNRMSDIMYDGTEHEPLFLVSNTKDKQQVSADNYYVVMSGDKITAGTQKFTVVGTGIYTGCRVTKSYKIKPCTDIRNLKIDANTVQSKEYVYTRFGAVFEEGDLIVSNNDTVLEEGKDYKITYSGNKKVTDKAKYSVTFLGNYKGVKNVTNQKGTFQIVPADLSRQNYQAAALDKVYTKPAVYKTNLYVTVDDVLLKASDYTVTYRLSDGTEMKGKNKLDLSKTDGMVTVQIQGKGNYCGTIETSYKVYPSDNLYDLAKARVTVVDDDGKKLKNVQFDGNAQTVSFKIEVKDGKRYREITPEEYHVLAPYITYANNVYKGKASVIINGDGETFAGGKVVTFNIVSKNITTKK
ncbi:MAG: chitobiase/beta-hexosaminidase C-terminal domain-containing protein [Lachnospiraceae bacterium]|nr:chitobiase/beta-hexosaminidase C-terminal domain-containing protein [Lachnospiraceae bacterium]